MVMIWRLLTLACALLWMSACVVVDVNATATSEILHKTTLSSKAYGPYLSVWQVLLPYNPDAVAVAEVSQIIEGVNGCYSWNIGIPDVASIQPLYLDKVTDIYSTPRVMTPKKESDCSTAVLVTSKLDSPNLKSTSLFAKERDSGDLLSCEVFVDAVKTVSIRTTTRILHRDELEVFDVEAFDKEGNVFTTLTGLSFTWKLIDDEGSTAEGSVGVLELISFRDSNYEPPETIDVLEGKGLRGDRILVRGTRTGYSWIHVKLAHEDFADVPESRARILVIDPIRLMPYIPIYMVPGGFATYILQRTRQGDLGASIDMPTPDYAWETQNETVATVDEYTGIVYAQSLGHTQLVVSERALPENTGRASVYVVEPTHPSFRIVPADERCADNYIAFEESCWGDRNVGKLQDEEGSAWVLESGRTYLISVELWDNNNPIIVSDNIQFTAQIDTEGLLEPLFSSANSSYHVLRARDIGTSALSVSLSEVVHPVSGQRFAVPRVSARQSFIVYDPVVVMPQHLYLPWHPQASVTHRLLSSGGSGRFVWVSSRPNTVVVVDDGVVVAVAEGFASIRAIDVQNPRHGTQVVVSVRPATSMRFAPIRIEAIIGESLELPLAIFTAADDGQGGSGYRMFDDCSMLPISWRQSQTEVFHLRKDSVRRGSAGGCVSVTLTALREGHTHVYAAYVHDGRVLTADVLLYAYAPLRVVNPNEGSALVTLGASIPLTVTGGPLHWASRGMTFRVDVVAESPNLVTVESLKAHGRLVADSYKLTCRALGTSIVTVRAWNNALGMPASVLAVKFTCHTPHSLNLLPVVAPLKHARCASWEAKRKQGVFVVPCRGVLPINVAVFDESGRHFDSYDSLDVVWGTSASQLIIVHPKDIDSTSSSSLRSANEHIVRLTDTEGTATVWATVTGYTTESLSRISKSLSLVPTLPLLRSSVELRVVCRVTVQPPSVVLLAHPQNTMSLRILYGSGEFSVEVTQPATAPVVLADYDVDARIMTVHPSQLGRTSIAVVDHCLEPEKPAIIPARVTDAQSVRVVASMERILLHESMYVLVTVMDGEGQPFSVEQHVLMDLAPSGPVSGIELIPAVDHPTGASHSTDTATEFHVTGSRIGNHSLSFTVLGRDGHIHRSRPIIIQVYAPLRLNVKNVTLVRGARFQMGFTGGPFTLPTRYTTYDSSIATVDGDDGTIEAMELGSTQLTARVARWPRGEIYGAHHGPSYGRDDAMVNVIVLGGIRIHSPIHTVIAGTESTLHIVGSSGESPFTFATVSGLHFDWSISGNGDNVVELLPTFHGVEGATLDEEADFVVRVHALRSGTVKIFVRARCSTRPVSDLMHNNSDEILLHVIEELVLNPTDARKQSVSVLLPPSSEYQIKSNLRSRNFRFRALEGGADVVTVDGTGRVDSLRSQGHATILATTQENNIIQTAVILINVHSPRYLSIEPIIDESVYFVLPMGHIAKFSVTVRDDASSPFEKSAAHRAPLDVMLSDRHVVRVQLGKGKHLGELEVEAIGVGESIMKVSSSEEPNLVGFLRLRAGWSVKPSLPVIHIGTYIKFQASLATTGIDSASSAASWHSTNTSVVTVDPVSGVGVANSVGSASISFGARSDTLSRTRVTVVPVESIDMGITEDMIVTNIPTPPPPVRSSDDVVSSISSRTNTHLVAGRSLRIPITFKGPGGATFTRLPGIGIGHKGFHGYQADVPEFTCVVDNVATALEIWGSVDPMTGDCFCHIEPLSLDIAVIGIDQATLTVIARQGDNLESPVELVSSVTLPFAAGFVVSTDHVHLSARSRSVRVFVLGSRPGGGPAVRAANSTLLSARRVEPNRETTVLPEKFVEAGVSIDPTSGEDDWAHLRVYVITVTGARDSFELTDAVELYDAETGQRVTISVSYIVELSPAIVASEVSSWPKVVFVILTIAVVVIIRIVYPVRGIGSGTVAARDGVVGATSGTVVGGRFGPPAHLRSSSASENSFYVGSPAVQAAYVSSSPNYELSRTSPDNSMLISPRLGIDKGSVHYAPASAAPRGTRFQTSASAHTPYSRHGFSPREDLRKNRHS